MAATAATRRFQPITHQDRDRAEMLGLRFGDRGTHTSRTLMLEELRTVLGAVPPNALRDDYARVIVEENCLGKQTAATRKLTNQRLGELYGLDGGIPVFRVLRRLWVLDEPAQPLLALLCALARDPLLVATAETVLALNEGDQFPRVEARDALRDAVGGRLNDSVLHKVLRNAASSWTQSGHLTGRTFKVRKHVQATPAAVAYALYFGTAVGVRGPEQFTCGWMAVLDVTVPDARELALGAKRLGLIDLRLSSDVFHLNVDRLDPWTGRV